MSGGHFDYKQYKIDDIVDSLESYIYGYQLYDDYDVSEYCNENSLDKKETEYVESHMRTLPNKYGYSKETINILKRGLIILKEASIYANRIDWLLSGDDSEESFKERLERELKCQNLK